MRPILVTGGAGFIGSAFVKRWLTSYRGPVVNLDKLTYAGNLDSIGALVDHLLHSFVVGDVCCPRTLKGLLASERPKSIIHFAAESHVDRSIDGPADFLATNVVGTFELLRAALAYWQGLPSTEQAAFRFLHVSTDEVYGSAASGGAFHESSPYAPNSPYAASKAAADHFVRAYHHTYGLPTLVSHCSNNYGPFQFPEKLIPHMILAAHAGRPLPVYGDGLQERDWLHVDDHCTALEQILDRGSPGEVYHVGTGEVRTNRIVVETICDLVDAFSARRQALSRDLIQSVPDRPGHDRRYCVDSSKLRRELGWAPAWQFEAGLRSTVEWYLTNTHWVERVTSGQYRWKRLGLPQVHTAEAVRPAL